MSILLVSALSLDSTGTAAQNFLVVVLHSLLGLEIALKGYFDTLHKCEYSSTDISTRALYLSARASVRGSSSITRVSASGSGRGSHSVSSYGSVSGANGSGSNSALHRDLEYGHKILPNTLDDLYVTVNIALDKLIKGYKDVIVTNIFPELYSNSLKIRIAAMDDKNK